MKRITQHWRLVAFGLSFVLAYSLVAGLLFIWLAAMSKAGGWW